MQTSVSRRTHRATALKGLGWLAASGTLALALIGPGAGQVFASGGIVVDGNRSEWNKSATWVADLQKDGDGVVEASLYVQADCNTGTLFAMVETPDGVTIQDGALQQVDPSLVATKFVLSPDGHGWEASYPFPKTGGAFSWSPTVTVYDTHFPYENANGTVQSAKGSFRFAVTCAVATPTSTGQVGAATGKPRVTPPSTSTGAVSSPSMDDGASRLLIIGFGIMIAGILLLVPSDRRRNAGRRR